MRPTSFLFFISIIFTNMVKAEDVLLMSVNKYLGKEGIGCAVLTSKLKNYPTIFSKHLISLTSDDSCYLTQLADNGQKTFVINADPFFNDESLYYVNESDNQIIKINLNHLDNLNESNFYIYKNTLLISSQDDHNIWKFTIPTHIENKKEVIWKDGSVFKLQQPAFCHNRCLPINFLQDKTGLLWVIYKDKNKFNYLAKYDNDQLIGEYDLKNKLKQQFYRLYLSPENKMYLLAKENEHSTDAFSHLYELNIANSKVSTHRLIIWNEYQVEIPQILGLAFYQQTTYLVTGSGISNDGDYIYQYKGFAPEKTIPISQFTIPGITDIAIASK